MHIVLTFGLGSLAIAFALGYLIASGRERRRYDRLLMKMEAKYSREPIQVGQHRTAKRAIATIASAWKTTPED